MANRELFQTRKISDHIIRVDFKRPEIKFFYCPDNRKLLCKILS